MPCPDDGHVCNGPEYCNNFCPSAVCSGDNFVIDPCCDKPVHAVCASGPIAPDLTICDDGNPCTGPLDVGLHDVCRGGLCEGGPERDCDVGIPCKVPLPCNPLDPGCRYDTSGCECTNADAPTRCDDGKSCTTDTCGPDLLCRNEPLAPGTPCPHANADPCDGEETCQGSDCAAGVPLDCGDPCVAECIPNVGCPQEPPNPFKTVTCTFEARLRQVPCAIPKAVTAKTTVVLSKIDLARRSACTDRRKPLKVAKNHVAQATSIVRRKKRKLDATCREVLLAALDGVRAGVQALLANPDCAAVASSRDEGLSVR